MSSKEKHFKYLVEQGNPVGEVVTVQKFLVKLRGLQPVTINALVMFEDGSKGYVTEIGEDTVSIMHLGVKPLRVGTSAVVQHHELVAKVGEGFIGRVVSVTGEPLDGKGPINASKANPVFSSAPSLISRKELDQQLETGVTLIDAMFPILLGQRLAFLGDSKSGKSTLLTQVALNQKDSDRIVVYALIAKRRSDVNDLLIKLEKNDAMKNAIVIVSTTFDSLAISYLAPYVACAMAEYFWLEMERDTIIIYDDLTNHAHVYREMSLLAEVSPGRDSYPGDMFFSHSSLLERAGRLESSGKTLTSLPIVHVPGGDISTYLPTNVMSITDGQIILDMELFRDGFRPAISSGLSVSRVGGHGHNARQKKQGSTVLMQLARYSQAAEFAHFGSELALEARADLELGEHIKEAFVQAPGEYYSLTAQQLLIETVLGAKQGTVLDINKVKSKVNELAKDLDANDDGAFKIAADKLMNDAVLEMKGAESLNEAKEEVATGEPKAESAGEAKEEEAEIPAPPPAPEAPKAEAEKKK